MAIAAYSEVNASHMTSGTTCREPYDLDSRLYRSMRCGESYTLNVSSYTTSGGTDVYFYGTNQCLRGSHFNDGDTQERALCPWYNVMNFDMYRVPRVIAEARCSCERCRVLSASVCEPVYAYVRVLRRNIAMATCTSEGHFLYQESWEKITVACTCALPRTLN